MKNPMWYVNQQPVQKQIVLAFFALFFVLGAKALAADCKELFQFGPYYHATSKSGAYVHLYLSPGMRKKDHQSKREIITPSNSEWLRFILSIARSKEALQMKWPITSDRGQIWTAYQSRKLNDGSEQFVGVKFTFNEGYFFFDPLENSHFDLWNRWVQTNSSLPNRFPPALVRVLEKEMFPWHSGFYDAYKIIGLAHVLADKKIWQGPLPDDRTFWTVINFDSVKNLEIEIPRAVQLDPSLERQLQSRKIQIEPK